MSAIWLVPAAVLALASLALIRGGRRVRREAAGVRTAAAAAGRSLQPLAEALDDVRSTLTDPPGRR